METFIFYKKKKKSAGLEVGLAWLNQLCNYKVDKQNADNGKKQYVSGTGVTSISKLLFIYHTIIF
jgi:hypothetical protein